jgi:hypothetical protein
LRRVADISTGVLVFLSLALDVLGRAINVSALWISGAYVGRVAIVAGIVALVLAVVKSGVRGVWLRAFGLVLFCLASWVRGAPGVPPDRVILLAGAAALALIIAGIRRRPASAPA